MIINKKKINTTIIFSQNSDTFLKKKDIIAHIMKNENNFTILKKNLKRKEKVAKMTVIFAN